MAETYHQTENEREERTTRLADTIVQENVLALSYGPDMVSELAGLSQAKRLFDVVVVDCTVSGFFFTAQVLIEAAEVAGNLLQVQGAMVFVKADQAVAIVKESAVGSLSFHSFETLAQIYDYSPSLARQIQLSLGQSAGDSETSSDLSEQILFSSIPILTTFGIKLKAGMESNRRRNYVLSSIDNYTPLSTIAQKLAAKMSFAELLDELRLCEDTGVIYPLFAKIPFLVHCFRTKIPFKLKEYLLESHLVTQEQLDSLNVTSRNQTTSERLSLGALCVAKGFMTSRQLEIALQDQAFYGQTGESEKVKVLVDSDQKSRVRSFLGHLGSTDPSGLLQSLATNREKGVLSVEHKDRQFRAIFDGGRLLRAKLGKLIGNMAVVEFVSVWKDGIFVFLDRPAPADLSDESCAVTRPIDKLLLDSALATDNINSVLSRLPKGSATILEKLEDGGNLFASGALIDPQEGRPLSAEEISIMQRLWKEFDGLASVESTIKKIGDLTTARATSAIGRLLHFQLVKVLTVNLQSPLEQYQLIVQNIAARIGVERSNALLRLSLQASQGYSAKARMFQIGSSGEVGVDLALARAAGLSLSEVLKYMQVWQSSYFEYVSQEIDRTVLREIIQNVYDSTEQQRQPMK